MTISLSPELEGFVNDQVSRGAYKSPAEVVEAALKLFGKQDEVRKSKLEHLRALLDVGIKQADAGMLIDADEAFDEVLRELDEAIGASEK